MEEIKQKEIKEQLDEAAPRFLVSSSPHVHDGRRVVDIMRLVIIALMPATLFSVYLFGLAAIFTIIISIGSAVLFEAAWQRVVRKPVTVNNLSAALTGLLLALNLPATSTWWMILVANFFAIVITKQFYGGLGHNIFNPALVGRVVLLIAFPVHMTAKWVTAAAWGAGAVTTATPLGRAREALLSTGRLDVHLTRQEVYDLLLGFRAGSLGEVSVALLVLGGVFLIAKKVISWHIPVSFIASVWVMTALFHYINPARYADPSFHVITGGLFLGAIFMATDYVTSPITPGGKLIFGVGCGVVTVVIRLFGAYPEGVSFAILLMNAFTPLIDRYVKPVVFGARKEKSKAAA